MHRVRSSSGSVWFPSWDEVGSSQLSSCTFSIYLYLALSAFSNSHPTFASFLSLSNTALIKATIWQRSSLLIFLEAVWTMFVQLYPVFSNQDRQGNMLMSFPHKSREHVQVKIMWLELLFSILSDVSSLTGQSCQFGYCQCQQYTSLAFWILFSSILPEAVKAELCFGNTAEFWPNFAGLDCQARSHQSNLFLMKNNN